MRIGLQTGPERGRYREKVARLIASAQAAEAAGFDSVWVPQIPDEFDALTAAAMVHSVAVGEIDLDEDFVIDTRVAA